jgi:SAM-dependent methyltransferase
VLVPEANTRTTADAPGARARPTCGWCGQALESASAHPEGRLPCTGCGAHTTWPPPSEAELEGAYGSWYRPSGGRFSGLGDRLLTHTRGRLARRLARIAPPGRILDVGAGDGALLDALAASGRDAIGLERRSVRDDVWELDVTEVNDRWAAIVFWHSLEHLREAGAALEHAANLLLPGGLLVVAMPNLASLQARAFGDRWFALDLPRHLVHVPAPALLARLRDLGLRAERTSYLRGGQVTFGWLHGIIGALPGGPDLYDAIRRPAARRVAVSRRRRLATLAAGGLALPLAAVCAGVEAAAGRGGTVYVEARRG